MSFQTFISLLENVVLMLPALLTVAFVTVAERKTMASMQRRLGPNAVGYYGLLQAFADALKLIIKEYVAPTQANIILFFLGPIVTLVFALLVDTCSICVLSYHTQGGSFWIGVGYGLPGADAEHDELQFSH